MNVAAVEVPILISGTELELRWATTRFLSAGARIPASKRRAPKEIVHRANPVFLPGDHRDLLTDR
jgi:hypothetical protein